MFIINNQDQKNDLKHNVKTYCGLIALVGRPNVGKSTVMNHLIKQKISIVSRRPQTTQHKITGVISLQDTQFVFIDTPGFQKKYINKLNTLLNASVVNSISDVDVVVFVIEASIFNEADVLVASILPKNSKVILVINKIDKLKNKLLLKEFISYVKDKLSQIQSLNILNTITLAAKHNIGTTDLLSAIKSLLPVADFLYPEDALTNHDSKFLVSEIIREKIFHYLGEELPYNVIINIDSFVVEKKCITINAVIFVDKDSKKAIIIGNSGEMLKKIATKARIDMEKLLDNKVFLQIWVKVKKDCLNDPRFLSQFK